jgi:hypothetical protein
MVAVVAAEHITSFIRDQVEQEVVVMLAVVRMEQDRMVQMD